MPPCNLDFVNANLEKERKDCLRHSNLSNGSHLASASKRAFHEAHRNQIGRFINTVKGAYSPKGWFDQETINQDLQVAFVLIRGRSALPVIVASPIAEASQPKASNAPSSTEHPPSEKIAGVEEGTAATNIGSGMPNKDIER